MYSYKVFTIVVLILLLGAVSLSTYSLVTNTWWVGDFTVTVPIHNVTKGQPYVISLGIHVSAGLLKTCWHVEQTKKSLDHAFKRTFSPSFDSCLDEEGKLFQETRACVIAALVLSCLVVLLQLVNIYVRNSCLVKANIGFNSLAATFTMAALIVFNENVTYDTLFMKADMNSVPTVHETLKPPDRSLLLAILTKLYKSKPKIKFTKGDAFMFLWSAEILFIASFIFLIVEHIFALRSRDRDYKKELLCVPKWKSVDSMD